MPKRIKGNGTSGSFTKPLVGWKWWALRLGIKPWLFHSQKKSRYTPLNHWCLLLLLLHLELWPKFLLGIGAGVEEKKCVGIGLGIYMVWLRLN